nr:MAG TPA: hypothetical protein [Microviridae sp.]
MKKKEFFMEKKCVVYLGQKIDVKIIYSINL